MSYQNFRICIWKYSNPIVESGPELIVVPQQRIQANHSNLNIYFFRAMYNVLILIAIIGTLPQHPRE